MNGFNNGLCSSINTKLAAVQTKIIAVGRSPFLIGVIIIVTGTALVCFVDHVFGFLGVLIVFLGTTVDTPVKVCMDKYAERCV